MGITGTPVGRASSGNVRPPAQFSRSGSDAETVQPDAGAPLVPETVTLMTCRPAACCVDDAQLTDNQEGHRDQGHPHPKLRQRVDEVAAGRRAVSLYCASSVLPYLATRVLLREGFDAHSLSGGWLMLQVGHPNPSRPAPHPSRPSSQGASTMRTHTFRSWIRPVAAAVLAVAAITGASACSSSAPEGATPPTGRHLAASDFLTLVQSTDTIVLDVRTKAEFASGRLPRAKNIDIQGSDFATRIAALDKKATYAVYCQNGKRSDSALQQMAAAGFTHIHDLTGGIGAWQAIGGTVIPGAS